MGRWGRPAAQEGPGGWRHRAVPSCPPIQPADDASAVILDGAREMLHRDTRADKRQPRGSVEHSSCESPPSGARACGEADVGALWPSQARGHLSRELGRCPTGTWQPVQPHRGECSRPMTVERRNGWQ